MQGERGASGLIRRTPLRQANEHWQLNLSTKYFVNQLSVDCLQHAEKRCIEGSAKQGYL